MIQGGETGVSVSLETFSQIPLSNQQPQAKDSPPFN